MEWQMKRMDGREGELVGQGKNVYLGYIGSGGNTDGNEKVYKGELA
jgi:hypothetical protein